MKWGSILNILLAVWLFCSPWALHLGGAAIGNNVVFGILAFIAAWWAMAAAVDNHTPAWFNVVFGVWMFISPWVLGYAVNATALWNGVVVGILMVAFAIARMSGARYPTAGAI